MARNRSTKRPPKEDAPEPTTRSEPALESDAVAVTPPPEPRISVTQYIREARLAPMPTAVLTALHATTKATRDEWAQHLSRALNRRVP